MNSIKNVKYNNKLIVLGVALLVYILNQIPFLLDMRPIMYDEPWYMNPAFNLIHGNGLHNTLVGSGGNVNFIAPLLMAGAMKILGESLLTVRLVAVICGFASIFILHFIMNELECHGLSRVFGYGIFLSISIINSTFRYVRPEFAAALFVLLGILFTLRYHRSRSLKDIIGISVSIYLASCSHPYSLYLFALIGCSLLHNIIKTKEWRQLYHMLILIITAGLVVITLVTMNKIVNDAETSNGIMNRFSMGNAMEAMVVSMKHVFIKHGVYTIPFLLVQVYTAIKYKTLRWITIPNLIFIFTFPLLFSTDLAMVGNSVLYYSLLSIVVCCMLIKDWFCQFNISNKRQSLLLLLCILFCIFNWGISTTFNYIKRYEKCNSILAKDIDTIVPDNSLVFGSIRFWPFKMNSTYYCDHNGMENIPTEYDYLILSSVDEQLFKDTELMKRIEDSKEKYKTIYTRNTKQYGTITIWRHL